VAEHSATVVEKIRVVMDAFGFDDAVLGISEMARRTGLPKTTVHRLAEQLVEHTFLERAGHRYQLGMRLFELGQLVPQRRRLRDTALPFLEDVYVATRDTVHLAIADGLHVLYVEKLSGHRGVDRPSRVAGRMPMHCTATGKAVLAHSAPDVFARLVSAPLDRLTPYTIVVPDVLAAELDRVRTNGFSVEREETRVGFASVAAPVFGRDGLILGALSVTGLDREIEPDRVAFAVVTAARGLSRELRRPDHRPALR